MSFPVYVYVRYNYVHIHNMANVYFQNVTTKLNFLHDQRGNSQQKESPILTKQVVKPRRLARMPNTDMPYMFTPPG